MKGDGDPFDLEKLRLKPEAAGRRVGVPRKILKRRKHFVMVPFEWLERLQGAGGQTYALALRLLYLSWKAKGQPFKLANGMLKIDGIGRSMKWEGLGDLEHRGLISIERRPRKSPRITVNPGG